MGSTKTEVEVSYDVSNEFFRLWLDERMNYTSAVYESPDQSLEAAQLNKLGILSDFAKVGPEKKVLDIGCGWGAALEYVTTSRGAKRAVGITLSTAQSQEVNARKIPGAEVVCTDFRKWETDERFDSLISICMMDHLCSPAEARQGKAVDIYRAFFKRCWDMTNPGAWFGLQTILRNRTPRMTPWGGMEAGTKKELEDIYFCTHTIFPGGLNPRMEEIIQAVNPWWEVVTVKTRRQDYQRTTGEWLRRMRLNETLIRSKWGDKVFDDYDRYLSTCVNAFDKHYSSLAQYELRRIDG
ncbi:class I SAM-dependent methyltransferase [Chondromyces apiculatus]|uniref:Cyclopropane-fatty-acyl-phospholipid synthase n=1 Tax=Chondromyces apiculatus DSM 436 TaxID=1192034 RepID=A0A017T433_9BACT|nr:class I SAM-dependent methyltransferase [Chondromyces apiculatus]EYF03540.1 Cyclopropane-fatty-acyl-phospholipid synthase [Chondromyces apiculatus DSM 436]